MDKDGYLAQMEARFAQAEAKIAELSAETNGVTADTKVQLEKELKGIERKKQDFVRLLDDLRSRSEDAWEDLTDRMQRSWDGLRGAVDHAFAPREKIAWK